MDTVVRGHHVYKDVWKPRLGELLLCKMEFGNIHDPYAVSVVRDDGAEVVGHVPRKISSLCYFFIKRKGTIFCQVTGKRRRSVDLPQGGLEVPCTLTFIGDKVEMEKVKRLLDKAPSTNIEPPQKKAKVDTTADSLEVLSNSEDEDDCDDQVWLQYHGCLLTESDKMKIESNDLLSDEHINYAQTLLHYNFPHIQGLQNPLFQNKQPRQKIEQGVQIIHDRKNHWIATSTIGSDKTVQVYDSIFSIVADATKKVIMNLFKASEVEVMKTEKQSGYQDCGLFAIATVTALLNGINVPKVMFAQTRMREHLLTCFVNRSMTPFPIL